jgi:hypothetical protein
MKVHQILFMFSDSILKPSFNVKEFDVKIKWNIFREQSDKEG